VKVITTCFGYPNLVLLLQRLLSRRRLEPYATDPRCLADEVLAKMNKNDLKEDALFTEENFAVTFSDIMQGGIDITSNVVNFIVLLLATHPAAQEKCFQEIEAILGPRAPSIGDRARYFGDILIG